MNQIKRYSFFLSCFILLIVSNCTDKWDEHTKTLDSAFETSFVDKIKTDPNLSTFYELLKMTKYDSVLSSSRNFTVWAPTNDVLANLDKTLLADSIKLKSFVGNHIAFNTYLTSKPNPFLKLRALNGKNVIFTNTTVDEVTITKANQIVSNGVFHIINGMIQPKQNVYEFLQTQTIGTLQRDFIESFNKKVFDPTNAEIIKINPTTGLPIYKTGTDSVIRNQFAESTKINREDSLFTYVILDNNAFTAEENKLQQYFKTVPGGAMDTTKLLTRTSIVNDLVFKGLYLPGSIPDSISSLNNVNVHLDPSAIVSSNRVSNGIVYIMKRIDYKVPNKLKTILIEGESSRTPSIVNMSNYLSTRRNPDGVSIFTQLRSDNLSVAKSWFRYTRKLNSVKYRVYWRAVRDFGLEPLASSGIPTYFRQRIAFKKFDATDALPYKFVEAKEVLPAPATGPRVFVPSYDDVYVGEYTISNYGDTHVFVVSNDVNTVGLNSIVLDYIKLIPVEN